MNRTLQITCLLASFSLATFAAPYSSHHLLTPPLSGHPTAHAGSVSARDAPLPTHHSAALSSVINGVCLDRSASYNPSPALHEAVATIDDQVDDLVYPDNGNLPTGGSPPHTLFIWTISNNTYDPRELRLTIQVPGIPGKPTPPNPNPISPDDTLNAVQHYQQAVRAYEQALARARAIVSRVEQAIRAIPLPWENTSTDVWGCLQRASEAHVSTLTIASDLDYNGTQQVTTSHSFRGVKVRVIDFLCGQATTTGNQARVCQVRKAYWLRAFARSGTTNVQFFFPGQPVGDLFTR